jgi:hypothetical protein
MTKTLKQFDVTARLVLVVQQTIKAENMEAALVESKTLRETDFVKFLGDCMDGSIAIAGVSKAGCWNTEQEEGR